MSHPVYYYDIVKRPILSEKSHRYAEQNILSLIVGKLYTKVQIKKAVEALMGFKVQSVNTINVKPRAVRFRGNKGKVGGYKKAIVTIDKSVKINNDKLIV